MMLDDLELELRKLPGVRAAGFEDREDLLLIQLHLTAAPASDVPIPLAATRIAARHSDRPVAVEVIRWREHTSAPAPAITPQPESVAESVPSQPTTVPSAPSGAVEPGTRLRLLAVLSFPDTDELEVHLILDGRGRTIGRAPATQGLRAAVDATLSAIAAMGIDISAQVEWVRPIDSTDTTTVVAVCLNLGDTMLYGMAAGSSPIDSAARAALDALNRKLNVGPAA